ncbi:protein ergS [Aspergillus undulatus]|uniref:protein ergS n=1 Tax=Aspergillus undulatus TaxID=1810928 RepID=UPI003CCE1A69
MASTQNMQATTKTTKGRRKQSSIPANTGKPRTKALLADTIGRSLCSRQSHSLSLTNKQVMDSRLTVPVHGLSPSLLSVPQYGDQLTVRSPSTASISSEALTANSHDITPSCTSELIVNDEQDGPLPHDRIVGLHDTASAEIVERLAFEHGLASQMGLLDPSYQLFVNKAGTGALSFKVVHKIAVIMGDPLCEPHEIPELLKDFKEYRRRKRLGIAFLGAGKTVARYASRRNWAVLQFGANRILNPQTNEIVLESAGKRILTQNRQLLNPTKGGITLDIYTPSLRGADYKLQNQLGALYDEWRLARNTNNKPQAFITEYDPFLMPSLMTYIYSRDSHGTINGFAALRWVGANDGYHVDPCIAAPSAPRGITDLLLFASMAYARQLGISYLSVGYEPSESLLELSGMPSSIAHLTDRLYRHTFQQLPLSGKKAYFEKFRPDVAQDSPIHLVFSSRVPSLRQAVAVTHVANISLRSLFSRKLQPHR